MTNEDEFQAAPVAKRVHKAAMVAAGGRVSALCSKSPRAIDLRRESWTLIDDDVTCARCRSLLAKGTGGDK